MAEPKEYNLRVCGYTINVDVDGHAGGGGGISSTMAADKTGDEGDPLWVAAMNAIESLILAHAVAGVDISSPEYVAGLETSIEACANEY